MLIPSKLTRPSRLHNAIIRPRVLERLDHAEAYKVVLFQSPAGYGKTTMATQWLADKTAVGWFSLDSSDNEPYTFANYFVRSINKATDQHCPNALALVERRQFSSLITLFGELFTELADFYRECYVVIDDYHLVTNDDIHEAMRFFLKNMPDNLTLVVMSRATPSFGIANLRVRDLVLEIDDRCLAFDNEETTRFFNQRLPSSVDESTVCTLCNYVEGWPSALQLIALQAQHQKRTLKQSALSVAQFNHAHLWDYLVEEVFAMIDADTQRFLLECSVLATFNETLVQTLTQRSDALVMLEKLNRYGLFIHHLDTDGQQNWYRFHHLFAEFLCHERQLKMPLEEARLQRAAAAAWLQLDMAHQALLHARRAEDSALITQIINEHGWRMFNCGDWQGLEVAIQELPDANLYSNIKIPLLQAWLCQSQHRYNDVGPMLERAEQELASREIAISEVEKGKLNALRAQVAINHSEPETALQLAELALSQLNPTDFYSRIVATSIVGEVNHVQGNLERALPVMQQTEKLARQHELYQQELWAMLQQSEILLAQGYAQAAYDMHQAAFALIEEQHLQQLPLHEFLLRLHAQILWCWNRLDEARDCAYRGMEVLGDKDPSKWLHSYSMLVRVALGKGELDQAGKFVEQLQQLLNQSSYHLDWTANASWSLLLYWHQRQDTAAIAEWLANAERPPQARNHFLQLQWRCIAWSQLRLQQWQEATASLEFLQAQAADAHLTTDYCRNLSIQALLAALQNDVPRGLALLRGALEQTTQIGMLGYFLSAGEELLPLMEQLVREGELKEIDKHRAQYLCKEIAQRQRSHVVHFDETFINNLLNHPNVPEFIRTSPLTQREWQVMGLIYSGFSNEQIAQGLDVAATTIKTHIRNLYQKLNITNRQQAIATAERLIGLLGMKPNH